MNDAQLNLILLSLATLQATIQVRDEENLKTMKFLGSWIAIAEKTMAISFPALEPGCNEMAEAFKSRIAKIESHHEVMQAHFSNIKSLLEGLAGAEGD